MKLKGFLRENRVWSALSAVASSVLTDLFYDEISATSYSVIMQGAEPLIVEVDAYPLISKLLIIAGVFLSIWLTIGILFPLIVGFVKTRCYKRVKIYSSESICKLYKEETNNVLLITEAVTNFEHPNAFAATLYISRLMSVVNNLYVIFCSPKSSTRRSITASFRNGGSLDNIDNRISVYEYEELLNEIERLLKLLDLHKQENDLTGTTEHTEQSKTDEKASTISDSSKLMQADILNTRSRIAELRSISVSRNKRVS